MFLDIHSHILHRIDDGSKGLDITLALMENMKSQGVTDIIVTPHFDPLAEELNYFETVRNERYRELKEALKQYPALPNVYLGCEMLYYKGISSASSLKSFMLGNTDYILLEPRPGMINETFLGEITALKEKGIIPIIAHIERYRGERGYKKFIEFIAENNIKTQINAAAFTERYYIRAIKKLQKQNIITFLASDTHSPEKRPPLIQFALTKITELFGKEYADTLILNSQVLLNELKSKENAE